jgi:hypothetical protein
MKRFPALLAGLWAGLLPASAALTGHWPFDGSRSNTVTGVVASQGGSGGGVEAYASAPIQSGFAFNGSTWINGGAGALNNTAYTKAAWVRRNHAATPNNLISGNAASQHAFWAASANSFRLAAGHNGAWALVMDSVALPTNIWFHVAVTYDAAENGGTLRLYKNGVPVAGTPVATGVPVPAGPGDLQLGGHNGGNFLNGALDDAAVWDTALSAAEIHQLYRAGLRQVDASGAADFEYRVFSLVPEASEFEIVYDYLIPDSLGLGTTGLATYVLDRTATFASDGFDRVAYYLELTDAVTNRWVWVACDPFTQDIRKLGVPSVATGALFQQPLTNLEVAGGGPYVTPGTGITTGNIEFWGWNYSAGNAAGVPNASSSTYDAGDTLTTGGTYGSMQIHNHSPDGGPVPQTLFAYNRWGAGNISDVGIGNAPSGNPDYTFAGNANTYTFKNLLVLARRVDLPDVTFSNRVDNLQLLPRDRALNRGLARVDGVVTTPDCQSISVAVTRLGAPYTNLTQTLDYGPGGAPFAFALEIPAELADYDFEVRVLQTGTNHLVHTAQDVVAGDVYLVNGQSNAAAALYNGSANGERSPWVRSFGYRTESAPVHLANLVWSQAEGDLGEGLGAVGQWPLRMGRVLVETEGVPVAIVNGARGGQPIGYFRRNDSHPEDLALNYGRLLHRTRQAGLDLHARALLWYQGESDNGDATTHENGFLELYRRWLGDYPNLEKVYVIQLHVGCGTPVWPVDLRDRQRSWPDLYDRLAVHAMTGLPQHTDNCHYAWATGYKPLGEQMAARVRRDLLGADLPSQVAPPNLDTAWFADASGTVVRLRTRNPEDVLTAEVGIASDFRVEGVTNAVATAVTALGHELEITFDRDVRGGTGLSFSGHTGGAPFLRNALGIGMLSFHQQPILASLTEPGMPTGLRTVAVGPERIDLAWSPSPDAMRYLVRRNGSTVADAFQPRWIDSTAQPGVPVAYQVAAVTPLGTSAWSSVATATTVEHNVFARVPEAADYDLLYILDVPADLMLSTTFDAPYRLDRSGEITSGVERVAYFLELQDQPGRDLQWVYASMQAFTPDTRLLGVPSRVRGAVFQQGVTDLNVYASANTSVRTGHHLTTGNLEFWGWNYSAGNVPALPNASATLYDHGDQINTGGTHGSMQLHLFDRDGDGPGTVGETIFAYNAWGAPGTDALGIGTNPGLPASAQPDYTFAANATTYNLRRLYVLVKTDVDQDDLPDAWERLALGGTGPDGITDSDGDGVSNRDEYLAGTDPLAAHSLPVVDIHAAPTPGGIGLSFPTVAGRLYDVETKAHLTNTTWSVLQSGLPGTGAPAWLFPTNALPRAYYRLGIRTP